MDYNKIYNKMMKNAKSRKIDKTRIYEKHHIIPKSMGGTDDSDNLVLLTPREHYIAHKLLYKIYKNKSMLFAVWMMTHSRKHDIIIHSRQYENLKEECRQQMTGENNHMYGKKPYTYYYGHTEETKKKLSEKNKGKTHTEETKNKISKANSGRRLTQDHRDKISNSMSGIKKPDDFVKKMSSFLTGVKKGPMPDYHKEKISKSLKGKKKSPEHVKKVADANRGKKKNRYRTKSKNNSAKTLIVHLILEFPIPAPIAEKQEKGTP